MALFAPIPRAKVSTAIAVKPGVLRSVRTAYLKSVIIGKTPNRQAPSSREAPNPKLQKSAATFCPWALGLGVSLEILGAWSLELSFRTSTPPSDRPAWRGEQECSWPATQRPEQDDHDGIDRKVVRADAVKQARQHPRRRERDAENPMTIPISHQHRGFAAKPCRAFACAARPAPSECRSRESAALRCKR